MAATYDRESEDRAKRHAFDAVSNLTPEQRFAIAWCDELHDGKELHGLIVNEYARRAAYWFDCDE